MCHFRVFTGTFRAVSGVLTISQKPQALPGLSRKVIAVSPYALFTLYLFVLYHLAYSLEVHYIFLATHSRTLLFRSLYDLTI